RDGTTRWNGGKAATSSSADTSAGPKWEGVMADLREAYLPSRRGRFVRRLDERHQSDLLLGHGDIGSPQPRPDEVGEETPIRVHVRMLAAAGRRLTRGHLERPPPELPEDPERRDRRRALGPQHPRIVAIVPGEQPVADFQAERHPVLGLGHQRRRILDLVLAAGDDAGYPPDLREARNPETQVERRDPEIDERAAPRRLAPLPPPRPHHGRRTGQPASPHRVEVTELASRHDAP